MGAKALVEAAVKAPFSHNTQPWIFRQEAWHRGTSTTCRPRGGSLPNELRIPLPARSAIWIAFPAGVA